MLEALAEVEWKKVLFVAGLGFLLVMTMTIGVTAAEPHPASSSGGPEEAANESAAVTIDADRKLAIIALVLVISECQEAGGSYNFRKDTCVFGAGKDEVSPITK